MLNVKTWFSDVKENFAFHSRGLFMLNVKDLDSVISLLKVWL